jgi:hypothetical protein
MDPFEEHDEPLKINIVIFWPQVKSSPYWPAPLNGKAPPLIQSSKYIYFKAWFQQLPIYVEQIAIAMASTMTRNLTQQYLPSIWTQQWRLEGYKFIDNKAK